MAFFNEFPHTRTYDSDLGWLIKEVKQWAANYETLVEFQQNIDEWKAGIDAEVEEVARQLDAYETRFEQLSDDLTAEINALRTELENEVNVRLNEMQHEIDVRLNNIDLMVSAMIQEIQQRMTELSQQLFAIIETANQQNRAYIEYRLDQFLQELPHYSAELIFVFNPVRGHTDNLQRTLNDLYDLARVEALTAQEYDNLKLTAEEYDDLELTAYEYDNYGKLRLGIGINLIRSPFDGTYQSTETLIWQLAGLHKNALTAQEYDNKELEAEAYDLLELSAYDYDWNGKSLIA